MDIFAQKPALADEGVEMQVRDINEEVIEGATITLLGKDSKVYQKILRDRQQATLNRLQKGRKAAQLDAEKLAEDSIEDLVKLTVAWTLEDAKGVMDCTPSNVKKVYTELAFIREQVQEFVDDRANFLQKPSSV